MKTCKTCGKTKTAGEFPRWGKVCRACVNAKQRQEYSKEHRHKLYEKAKRNPKYVERNREKAREYKRKKKGGDV